MTQFTRARRYHHEFPPGWTLDWLRDNRVWAKHPYLAGSQLVLFNGWLSVPRYPLCWFSWSWQ